jgi:fatty acid desaturase
MLFSYLAITVVFVAMYMPMFYQPTSWATSWVPFIAAAISGWSCAMMGLYFCHDACHASFSNSPFVWNTIRRIYEIFTGLNTLLWIYQHGLGHHPYTNVVGADPDIEGVGLDLIRLNPSKPWWSFHRWQKYYWLPLYSQLVLSRKLGEHISVFYHRSWKFVKINPPRISEYFWTFVTLVSIEETDGLDCRNSLANYRAVGLCYAPLLHPILLFPHAVIPAHRSSHYHRPHLVLIPERCLTSLTRQQRSRLAFAFKHPIYRLERF